MTKQMCQFVSRSQLPPEFRLPPSLPLPLSPLLMNDSTCEADTDRHAVGRRKEGRKEADKPLCRVASISDVHLAPPELTDRLTARADVVLLRSKAAAVIIAWLLSARHLHIATYICVKFLYRVSQS